MRELEEVFQGAREDMVQKQIARRGVKDARVLAAMRKVPRHLFTPSDELEWAYADMPLSIGKRQTISQPYIVAVMSELLKLIGTERVLEIGTGSGYQTAILGELAEYVYSLERIPDLAEEAQKRLTDLGYTNVQIRTGDGTLGLAEFAPYNGILVTAAAPQVPRSLLAQLAEGGRLVIPTGGRFSQVLQVWQRRGSKFIQEDHMSVVFVPLIGVEGWGEN